MKKCYMQCNGKARICLVLVATLVRSVVCCESGMIFSDPALVFSDIFNINFTWILSLYSRLISLFDCILRRDISFQGDKKKESKLFYILFFWEIVKFFVVFRSSFVSNSFRILIPDPIKSFGSTRICGSTTLFRIQINLIQMQQMTLLAKVHTNNLFF